jgi:dTDP-4-dehydrorhamnose 3,5-epimerase-like enzyme
MKNVEIIDMTLREDDRGWVAWPIEEIALLQQRISHVHVPCLAPSAVRGNHYHCSSIEFALVLNGPCRAVFEDNATSEREERLIEGNKPVLFKIAPDTTHAFRNEGNTSVFLICYEQRLGEQDAPDSFRRQIL